MAQPAAWAADTPVAERAPLAAAQTLAKPSATPRVRAGLAGSFLSGRFAKQNQDLKAAARYLSETLAHDPTNESLQMEAMRMHLLAGNIDDATTLAHQLSNNQNADAVVASLLMLESIKANDFEAAKNQVRQAPDNGLFGLIRPVLLEWIAVAAEGKNHAVDLNAAIEKAGFFAPFIHYQSALMNDMEGKKDAALADYTKANANPAVTPYRVVEALANFYARQGDWAKAQAEYDAYGKVNPQSSLIPKLAPGAATPKLLVGDAKQGIAELFFTTASILFGEDATQETFLYLRIALELRPNLSPAQLMLANLYEQVEDYRQAIATYDLIPESSVFYYRAQVRKALNLEALGKKDAAISLLATTSEHFPLEATALITKGDMERDAKNYDDAIDSYSEAIERTKPLDETDWPLLYARGISYERAGDWNKAEADLLHALDLAPEQPDVLNYLAYSWLVMNKNLKQARDYLEIAAAARPGDAHIIDSVGWAYYLSGDYKTAVAKFERAIELMPDDPTVNEHLGDAYFRVGRAIEARYQWERALTFKPEQEVVESLQNKLANGLPPLEKPSSALNATSPVEARATSKTQVR